MRSRLSRLARRLFGRWLPATRAAAAPRIAPGPRPEELEQRVALSGVPGAASPMACQCPFCGGAANYTFGNQSSPGSAYSAATKWSQPGGVGSAVTITYSFSNLLDGGLGGGLSAATIRSAIQEALGRWASVAPLNFVEVADSGPAPSNTDYSASGRPMLRFGRLAIDGAYSTLAYAYYPGGTGLAGDVTFDTGENWKVNPSQGIDLIEVATHEIGHALGLGHEPMPSSGGQQAIMNPFYGGRYSGPGTSFLLQDDINGIRALYGSGTGSVTPVGGSPTLPTTPADLNVIRSYYLNILGRAGSESDVQGWAMARAQGASWDQIARAFVQSVEANGRVVDQMYLTYLGRNADAGGKALWSQQLANGLTREQLSLILLTSREFTLNYSTNDSYVRALYTAVLGRSASTTEVNGWIGQLQAGASRARVASSIVYSQEAYARSVSAAYSQYLGRSADSAARQSWVGLLSSGQARLTDLDTALLSSREYRNRND